MNKELSEAPLSLGVTIIEKINFGYNYIPIISAIILTVFAFMYLSVAWPVSLSLIKGESTPKSREFPAVPGRIFSDRGSRTFFASSCIIFLILGVGGGGYLLFNLPEEINKAGSDEPVMDSPYDLPDTRTDFEYDGYLDENNEGHETFTLDQTEYVTCVRLRFDWEDEPDLMRRYDNQPDEFQIILVCPHGETFQSPLCMNDPLSGYGSIDINTSFFEPPIGWEEEDFNNIWEITIICGDCGDQEPMRSITGIRDIPDNGNNWSLTVEVIHC
jgi:hypothetical protein